MTGGNHKFDCAEGITRRVDDGELSIRSAMEILEFEEEDMEWTDKQ